MQKSIKNQKTIHLSDSLIQAIKQRLLKKEQVILLLNRRGYLPSVQCSHCYEIAMCHYCDVPLTYHKEDKKLHCHGCGQVYHRYECQHCHHHSFMGSGLATQRLQETIMHLFKDANVGRLDYDTTKIKDGHQIILDEFSKGNFDILIGTQMVAKGLDIPNVTLVGILYADAALSRHDYHVNETTFAMISQAAGRSGRHDKAGEVIVQAFDVHHYVLKAVENQDYDMFFKHEMHYRKQAQLPPYVYLISVIFVHRDQEKCYQAATALKHDSEQSDLRCLGPIDIGRSNNLHRYRLVYKSKDLNGLKTKLSVLLKEYQSVMSIRVNVSPLHLE
jgi:primosomal protein N' (replication factor Y) (superfamily II helicase)